MSKSKSSALNLNSVFGQAAQAGTISPNTLSILSARDVGQQIQDGLGVAADQFSASEAFLLGLLVDDSGSIRFAGNTPVMIDGVNLVVDALKASKSNSDMLALVQMLNKGLIRNAKGEEVAFCPLDQLPRLSSSNYSAEGGTPLYDRTIEILGTVLAKTEEFKQLGVDVRSATAIVTDGNDEGSRRRISEVTPVVRDMLAMERHIVAGIGIDDGHTDFRAIFKEMGIPDEWILTPKNSPSEIRKAFQVFSRSSVRASQGAASFSKAARSGLVSP